MRRVALPLALFLGACGGQVDVGGASDASVDDTGSGGVDTGGGIDTGSGFDGSGGTCGTGACKPGTTCKPDCNTCTCSPSGEWECTLLGCPPPCPPARPAEDSGCTSFGQTCPYANDCKTTDLVTCTVDASGVGRWKSGTSTCGSGCPASEPVEGTPCDGPSSCLYKGYCSPDTAICGGTKSYWVIRHEGPCSGSCPASEPKVGDPCMAGGKCSYTSACGASDIVMCDGTGTVKSIEYGKCPACPATEPTPLSPCSVALDCKYTNSCGGIDEATCGGAGESWGVLRGDCPH